MKFLRLTRILSDYRMSTVYVRLDLVLIFGCAADVNYVMITGGEVMRVVESPEKIVEQIEA